MPAATAATPPARVLWLIKGLGPGGAEHLLVAAASKHDRSAFAFEVAYLLPSKDALVGELEARGVPAHCLGVRRELDLRWALRLRRLLRAGRFDIVHSHSPYAAGIARLVTLTLPRSSRPRLVSTEHNPWPSFKPLTRWLNAATARLDAAIFAVSEETLASMSDGVRRRAETLAHGVALDDIATLRQQPGLRAHVRAELGVPEDCFLAGTVANYHPKKDWPNLLRAARLLADRGETLRWCAVGQGPLQAEVEALHRDLDLDGTVTLTGHRPDAVRLMAACDVFVLGSRREGLPVAIMEALALGLPVVATAVGGVAETFTDGVDALLVPPGRPDLLADAVARVAGDATLRTHLAEASARRASDFDVSRAVSRIEAVYREVLDR